ncbi:MAG: alkaline phosphatase family protein [Mycolicibacterium sp.]|uniref:alkaline phosphatase family protein n=1 Tax=Mycolicibacterium sp. TaxID=2320850 RepID=UPI003D0EFE63
MGFNRTIGRIGPLAVALGVGLAVTTTPGIAYADQSDSGSSSLSADGSSAVSTDAAAAEVTADGQATASDSPGEDGGSSEADGNTDAIETDTGDGDAGEDAAEAPGEGAASTGEDGDAEGTGADAGAGYDEVSPQSAETGGEPASAESGDDQDGDTSATGSDPAAKSSGDPVDEYAAIDSGSAPADRATGESGVAEALSGSASEPVEADGQDLALNETSAAAPSSARSTFSAAAVSTPATPAPTLRDVFDGIVRSAAQVVVDVLDLVLAAAGTSYDQTELPWGLAFLAAVRREIDEVFLAPYRAAQHATAQAAVAQSPNLLVNPGAEVGDPSLSGNSSVTLPGWTVVGTPLAMKYGTPRNSWPIGTPFPFPDLPSFMSFPKKKNGAVDGGEQFFGGGNVADSTLTQTVHLGAAASEIDTGDVTYNLSAWLGGWLLNLSRASVKVDFLDANKAYISTTKLNPVGVLERFFHTKLVERETSGSVPVGTRYAQVNVILDQISISPLGINVDYNSAFADNVSFSISADLPAPAPPTPPVSNVGELDHVFMVYMENKGYSDIVGSPNAPFLNSLIDAYGSSQSHYALTHPSLPNYYPIIGGTDYGLTYECEQVCIFDHGPILTTNIDEAGKTWRGYAQSQPPGQPLENSGDYSVAELPFVAFSGIGNNEAYAVQHLFPLEQMAIDLASPETTPDFAWFAANESYNGEGPIDSLWDLIKFGISQLMPTHQYNVPALDEYLSETVSVIMNSNVWHDPAEKSALFVTFDEDNDNMSLGFGDEGNHIVMVVIPSPGAVAAGMRGGSFIATDRYDHYSLLRTIEDSLGLPTLTNNDRFAVPMNEFWT